MSTNLQRNYQTDLTAEQWAILQPLIILPDGGRPKTTDLRQVMNAIFLGVAAILGGETGRFGHTGTFVKVPKHIPATGF
jgi:hypothetical protein